MISPDENSYAKRRSELRMNSVSIWKRNSHVYNDFFANSEVVASAPGVFFWAGEHVALRGGISICQHVPLRVYVGLEPLIFANEMLLGDHFIYNANTDSFDSKLESIEIDEEGIMQEIKKLCTFHALKKAAFKIHVLSELRPAAGCNWSGAFASALATAILFYNGKLNRDELNRWSEMAAFHLPNEDAFNLCNVFAWHIESVIHKGKASGYGNFCSLIDTKQPIVYYTEKRGQPGFPPIDVIKDPSWEKRPSVLDNIRYGGFRFRDKLCKEDVSYDVILGLIYSGILKNTGRRIEIAEKIEMSLEDARKTIKEIFSSDKNLMESFSSEDLLFADLYSKSTGKEMLSSYYRSLAISGIEVFACLHKLFGAGIDETGVTLTSLARSVCGIQGNLIQIGQGWYLSDLVYEKIKGVAAGADVEDKCGIKLTGGGGGGMLFFFMPKEGKKSETLQEDILSVIPELQNINENISLDWISTIDGLEKDGIRIEKPVDQKNDRFGVVPDKLIKIDRFYKGTKKSFRVYETDMNWISRNGDLVLNMLSYYKGRADHPLVKGDRIKTDSSRYTLELLTRLLDAKNISFTQQDITNLNIDLDIEGYEVSQIKKLFAMPLIDAIHEKTNKRSFEIICSTKTDEAVKLITGEVEIFIVESAR